MRTVGRDERIVTTAGLRYVCKYLSYIKWKLRLIKRPGRRKKKKKERRIGSVSNYHGKRSVALVNM